MKYITWAIVWPFQFLIGAVLFRILSPIACMFVVKVPHTTTVKRYNRQVLTLPRYKLMWWLSWFDTMDNATDEYWLGLYPLTKYFATKQYDNSMLIRWFMRVLWLQRNSAYGLFNTKWLTLAKDSKWAWQYQAKKPLWFGYYNDINIGFKSHKGIDRLMFAGRILGLRKY